MIISTLSHSGRIEDMHPLFKTFFEFVKTHDWSTQAGGRIDVLGDRLFINYITKQCVPVEQQVLEVHRDYIDIHVLLEGEETIGWKAHDALQQQTQPYDPDGDCALYADRPSCFVSLLPGQICVAFPEDPHAPLIGKGIVRKLIGKIKI